MIDQRIPRGSPLVKQALVKWMAKYFYPQNCFAASITRNLPKNKALVLIDCPCGNGETTYHFARIPRATVRGYDLNDESLGNARRHFTATNLIYEKQDIRSVVAESPRFDAFCIINSLYCFPDCERVLSQLRDLMHSDAQLFIIVDNIEGGENYRRFAASNSTTPQTAPSSRLHGLTKDEFRPFFESLGFALLDVTPIVYTHSHHPLAGRLLSIFCHFYLAVLNVVQTTFRIGSPNYYLIRLKRAPAAG
jgi:ubiquinone/menaquinone biosynthesis C-methylase UbiE